MPSSIFSSEDAVVSAQGPNAHHGPMSPGLRLTASDRPGIAQPVPERDVPPLPWLKMLAIAVVLVLALTALWEWRSRALGYEAGDLGTDPSAWAEQWHRLASENPPAVIVGDSRILFDTDLDRFQKMTGVRPVQLGLEGTNAEPVLKMVADSQYKGLVIVGIADQSYFRDSIGIGETSMKAAKWESPSARLSSQLYRGLRRQLAMLDDDNKFSNTVGKLDHGWVPGARGPYDDVWKLGRTHDDRQFSLWTEVERNGFVRAHAIRMWMIIFHILKPDAKVIAHTLAKTRADVAAIRARGGEVVFVRPPSAPALRAVEDSLLPRAKGWAPLLKAANVRGVHADDLPAIKGIAIPELSHISAACQGVFTDAYVRALTALTPRLRLRADAPPPLTSANCPKWIETTPPRQ
ncbi:hypothetical protein [Sphingomonas immobilis]|uniref:Uncharacterized protein n=1 Tax=Sphingomonas immobilis TaxID=3063997 RepID=A0ABT8ZZ95_9SPHN|nr:hypothetical protein [Sphingomonas sp. CA1-15]MDO7842907.1 hypothetical protein [Sphingomonas sp. CA1-15]